MEANHEAIFTLADFLGFVAFVGFVMFVLGIGIAGRPQRPSASITENRLLRGRIRNLRRRLARQVRVERVPVACERLDCAEAIR